MAKSASPTDAVLELPFRVESITRTTPPAGAEGIWHSYVISQGTNTITGTRAGDYAAVTVQLNEMVERLNERRLGNHRPKAKS